MVSNVTNINETNRSKSGDDVENLNVEHRAAEDAGPAENDPQIAPPFANQMKCYAR